MPPTPEDIDAARLLVYQWYDRPEIEPVLTVPQQHELADRVAEQISAARERGARDENDRCYMQFIAERGVSTPCARCQGMGVCAYGSSATWHGGVGGQTVTSDVCDRCWGSGDDNKRWPSHREFAAAIRARGTT